MIHRAPGLRHAASPVSRPLRPVRTAGCVPRRCQVDLALFERKARHRGRDPDRFGDCFADREARWQERWDKELTEYVISPPHFDAVLRAVRRELRFALTS